MNKLRPSSRLFCRSIRETRACYLPWAKTAILWARDTTDDDLQTQRLNKALANYRLAVAAASPEFDKVLLSLAHETMGRILAFLDRKDEALKEFDEAIKVGPVAGGAYDDAIAGKKS